MGRSSRCRRCRKEVIWAKTVRGRDIPLDYRRDERDGADLFAIGPGNVALVVREVQRAEYRAAGQRLYAPHSRFCRRDAAPSVARVEIAS